MKTLNRIILIGRLGEAPVLRETKSGVKVSNFPLATHRRIRRSEGEDREETQWHQIVVWGRHAEACETYLSRGEMVYVEGEVRTHRYQAEDGEVRFRTEVHAYEVGFLSEKKSNDSTSQAA